MPFHHYIPLTEPAKSGLELTLDPDRSAYLCRVMRARKGQRVSCFDGAGQGFDCEVIQASPKQTRLIVLEALVPVPIDEPSLSLGMCLIKGPGQDRAIASAVELGAAEIWLCASARTNVKLDGKRRENKLDHWRKVVIAAAEQSGRLHLPRLEMSGLAELMEQNVRPMMVLHEHAAQLPRRLAPANYLMLVGPEGGWSEEELAQFEAKQMKTVSLASHTLRAETVPSVALALCGQAMQP